MTLFYLYAVLQTAEGNRNKVYSYRGESDIFQVQTEDKRLIGFKITFLKSTKARFQIDNRIIKGLCGGTLSTFWPLWKEGGGKRSDRSSAPTEAPRWSQSKYSYQPTSLAVRHTGTRENKRKTPKISSHQHPAPNFPLCASPSARPVLSCQPPLQFWRTQVSCGSPPNPPHKKGVSQYHNYLVMGRWRQHFRVLFDFVPPWMILWGTETLEKI